MTVPLTVRVISRGINGQLILEGEFEVLHKGFSPDSRICLTLGDSKRRVLVEIPYEVLQDVDAEPTADSVRKSAELAESRVLERLSL